MRLFILSLFIILTSNTLIGQVKLNSESFDNGLTYPVFTGLKDQESQKELNAVIHSYIDSLGQFEMCIGDFGYVIRGKYLQIHLYHNCDYQFDTEHHYLTFDMNTATPIDPIELFHEEKYELLNSAISSRLKEYKSSNCPGIATESLHTLTEKRFQKEGILFVVKQEGCNDAEAFLSWIDLSEMMNDIH